MTDIKSALRCEVFVFILVNVPSTAGFDLRGMSALICVLLLPMFSLHSCLKWLMQWVMFGKPLRTYVKIVFLIRWP